MSFNSVDPMDVDITHNSSASAPIPHTNSLVLSDRYEDDSEEINLTEGDTLPLQVSMAASRDSSPIVFEEENSNENASAQNNDDEDDGTLCPICLDQWTSTGDHRICSLKCGHLFGYKCVNRWLETQPRKSCPTCKKTVRRTDMRYIYAKKLVAVDTMELDMMRQQLEEAVMEKNRILQDVTRYVTREHMLNQEITHLRHKIKELSGDKYRLPSDLRLTQPSPHKPVRLYMDKALEVCKQNGCRVFDTNADQDLIVASLKSPNSLWAGFGMQKISISNYRKIIFIPLHEQQIRDIGFHPTNKWVLTASMDKKFKVVDTVQNCVIFTGTHNTPLWSCAWDFNNDHMLYIGTQFGDVLKYDVRNISQPTTTLDVNGDMSPVVSVASIPSGPHSDLATGGVISCKLNSLWIFENAGESHIRHSLPLEGPFVSMKYEKEMKQLLVSSRPNNRTSFSRHTLCNLEKVHDPDSVQCHIIHSFKGGSMQKLLSKSCFVSSDMGSRQDFVAAHLESDKSVYLWSINTGDKVCSVPAHDAVLDLKGVMTKGASFLVSLTEKRLEFFKFNTT